MTEHHWSSRVGQIPDEHTTFVGRRDVLRAARISLAGTRLLTLVGPSGVGKTRLATRMAAEVQNADAASLVQWTRLAPVQRTADPAAVIGEVARAIGFVRIPDGVSRETLVDHLREQCSERRCLLVLDNCEHVVEQVSAIVHDLLAETTHLRVLATSQEPLGCKDEQVFLVPPMSYPALTTSTGQHAPSDLDAVALLNERAARAGVTIMADDAATKLCRLLDGIPLAIELVAAGLRTRSLEDVLLDLNQYSTMSRTRSRSADTYPRSAQMHHSLRLAIEWSYYNCSPPERLLWSRLSAFEAGWDRQAAEAIVGEPIEDERGLAHTVSVLLTNLVDKAIIWLDESGIQPRFRMPETVRGYGEKILAESGEREVLRERHRNHYLTLLTDPGAQWSLRGEVEWRHIVQLELPNLRGALEWSITTPGQQTVALAMAIELTRLRIAPIFTSHREPLYWLDRTLQAIPAGTAEPLHLRAMALAGWYASSGGDSERGSALLTECRTAARGRPPAELLLADGTAALFKRADPASVTILSESVDNFQRIPQRGVGDRFRALSMRAFASAWTSEPATALELTARCLDECTTGGSEWALLWAMSAHGVALMRHADPRDAITVHRQVIKRQRELHDLNGYLWSIQHIAWAHAELLAGIAPYRNPAICVASSEPSGEGAAQPRVAAQLLGAAERLRSRYHQSLEGLVPIATADARARALTYAVLGAHDYAVAMAEGLALPNEAIIELALTGRTSEPLMPAAGEHPSGGPGGGLTATERHIIALAAQGLSNARIAQLRACSVRTVEKHLENIRRKQAVEPRSEIRAWTSTVQLDES